MRVVRMRTALVFKGAAASGVRRLFLGPLFPNRAADARVIPIIPDVRNLRVQAVHSLDAGEAYRLALLSDARGPFNVAADPILDSRTIAKVLGARPVPFPAAALRAAASVTWRLHLQPASPGWVDLALATPPMDASRARSELGWRPKFTSEEALMELLEGLRVGAGLDTPPLLPDTGGRGRGRKLATVVGQR